MQKHYYLVEMNMIFDYSFHFPAGLHPFIRPLTEK